MLKAGWAGLVLLLLKTEEEPINTALTQQVKSVVTVAMASSYTLKLSS